MIYYFFLLPFVVVSSIFIMLNVFLFVLGSSDLMAASLLTILGILLLLIFIQIFVTIRIIYLKEKINKERNHIFIYAPYRVYLLCYIISFVYYFKRYIFLMFFRR